MVGTSWRWCPKLDYAILPGANLMLKKWLARLRKGDKYAGLTPISPKATPDPETAQRLSETQTKYANTGWLTTDRGRRWNRSSEA